MIEQDKWYRCCALALGVLLLFLSSVTNARRLDDFEFTFQVPYFYGQEIGFEGGTTVDVKDDVGFGFGLGYNYTENMAFRGTINWNSTKYDGARVLDNGLGTIEYTDGRIDIFTSTVGNDFYLTKGNFSPYINVNLGWARVDSNVSDGSASTICWWDPWFGYVCNAFLSTYEQDSWFYGAGVGLRMNINNSNFLRISYNARWLEFDNASGSDAFDSVNVEFGFNF